jgi:hypothetical protein
MWYVLLRVYLIAHYKYTNKASDTLPLTVSEKLLLNSYRAIPNKLVQDSLLTIAEIATK